MYKIYILIASVLGAALFFTVGSASAGIFDNKPPKPEIMSTNQDVIAVFDDLYDKYPELKQEHIDDAHDDLSLQCASWGNEDGESDSGLAEIFKLSFCQGFMNGMLQTWLDNMGVLYFENEDARTPPQLL